MKFEELPFEIQAMAAKTLADWFSPSRMTAPTSNAEPANELAREIREAFTELYSEPKKTCGQDH